ncbi:uncharacterized protein [Dendropsophus ebraccatus]|uniref:uncharacterized protein n=1 Tax=Dendropsophus ebraccatus TaxID=150705 RepID=UPI003831593C
MTERMLSDHRIRMASAELREELDCSICLSLYTDPVSLRCGHNFCRSCIVQVLDTQDGSGGYSCPDCRAEYPERPPLEKRRKLDNIVECFLSTQPDMEEARIFCTYCTKSPVPAVKSCLHCENSLCDDHLTAHNKTADHILTEPTDSFGNKKCPIHKKVLEFYCPQDAACLCVSCCLVGKHRGHQVELLDEASEEKKKRLRKDMEEINSQKADVKTRVQNLHEGKSNIQKKASDKRKNVSKLFMDIKEQLEMAEKKALSEISRQEQEIVSQISDLIKKLEIEEDELSRKMRHLEEMCQVTDPIRVLQEPDITVYGDGENTGGDGGKIKSEEDSDAYISDTKVHNNKTDPEPVLQKSQGTASSNENMAAEEAHENSDDLDEADDDLDETDEDLDEAADDLDEIADDLDEVVISLTLHRSMRDIISNVNNVTSELGFQVPDIFLDEDTASEYVELSEDLKRATDLERKLDKPKSLGRFLSYPQVLSRCVLASGRHYLEVEWNQMGRCDVGMSYASIEKEGQQSGSGDNDKSWCLIMEHTGYLVSHNSVIESLHTKPTCPTLGVFLDYEAGRLSFYELCDPIRHLHTFTASFTEPLHVMFYVEDEASVAITIIMDSPFFWFKASKILEGLDQFRFNIVQHRSERSGQRCAAAGEKMAKRTLSDHRIKMVSEDVSDEQICPICLSLYTDPVSLRCGHNFCRSCIVQVLDTQDESGAYSCPDCRAEYPERPPLGKRRKLGNVVECLSTQPDMEETRIFCTYCTKCPVPAVKSCLHCENSLCDDHLTAHNKRADHILTEPTGSFGNKKCPIHKKVLEYYCPQDATCLCVSCCLVGEHRGHQMELLDEASEKKRKRLKKNLEEINSQKAEVQTRVQNLHEEKGNIQKKAFDKRENVSKLFMDIKEQLEMAEKKALSEISRQEEKIVSQITDLIKKLEIEEDEMSRKMHHLEEMCDVTDPIRVLQEPEITGCGDGEDTEGDYAEIISDDDSDAYEFDPKVEDNEIDPRTVQESGQGVAHSDNSMAAGKEKDLNEMVNDLDEFLSLTLHHSIKDIISNLSSEIRFNVPDMLLDENTTERYTRLSEDLKMVTYDLREYKRVPREFSTFAQVLSRNRFSSGRHYWQVEWNLIGSFSIGVSHPSIPRRGKQSCIGNNTKSWRLSMINEEFSVCHNRVIKSLASRPTCPTLGVFLDYEAGHLSFYELCDPIRHLHTFSATFIEPLHAAFIVNHGASLKITS